jgi:RHS repeat-associated protein
MELSSGGWPVWEGSFTPFGQEIIGGTTTNYIGQQPADGTSMAYKFTGKERDAESGLDYFGARYYGSSMGRFMSPDPSGLMYANPYNPQSFNLYAYAYNNPLINIDPTGLECVWDDGSYDSNDDSSTGAGAVDGSGNHTGCSGQGGTWIDHSYFTSNNMADWSGQANAGLADMITPSATVTFNYDASWAAAYLGYWAAGQLPTSIQYGQNDPATLAMINRPYVQNQLANYKAAGCPATGTKAGQPSGAAYRETAGDAASGNTNYVQLEVGGYSGSITTSGGVTTVTLSNVSGISSLSGYSAGVGEINSRTGSHFNRNAIDSHSGAGQNVTQTFTQTMPSPCGGG